MAYQQQLVEMNAYIEKLNSFRAPPPFTPEKAPSPTYSHEIPRPKEPDAAKPVKKEPDAAKPVKKEPDAAKPVRYATAEQIRSFNIHNDPNNYVDGVVRR